MNMKKNSGFTLIELLAVIVILAIIALIATPVVLNIINSSKENANRNSVTFYGKAIDNAVKTYMASNNGKVPSGSYYSKGKMLYLKTDNTSKDIGIDYKGNDISCDTVIISEDGEIYITGCKIGNSEEYIYKEGSKTEYFAYGNKREQILVNSINITYDQSCQTANTCLPEISILPENADYKQLNFTLSDLYGSIESYTNSIDGALSINSKTGEITKLSSFIDNECYFVDVIVTTTDGSNITKTLTVQLTGNSASYAVCSKW